MERTRGAARYLHVHRDDVFHRAATRVADAELAAVAGAASRSDHQLRGGGGAPGASQGRLHVPRDRSRDQQGVGVAWRGDEVDAEAFHIVVGVVEGMDLQFAGVAGAGIHLADGETAAEAGSDDPF